MIEVFTTQTLDDMIDHLNDITITMLDDLTEDDSDLKEVLKGVNERAKLIKEILDFKATRIVKLTPSLDAYMLEYISVMVD